ncbi:hypothetical protein HY639_02490 [Candidatus Woesearchaeota archaeon]|nr:hypothetical protein [Candidatus Woesearchaeota archaeon]
MHDLLERTITELRAVPGLGHVHILSDAEKQLIAQLEEAANLGVHACLARPVTLVVTHDSRFREPVAPIVHKKGDVHVFPPVPFPEVKHPRVVSSSPSKLVHDFLVQKLNLIVTDDDATLLLGFELGNGQ